MKTLVTVRCAKKVIAIWVHKKTDPYIYNYTYKPRDEAYEVSEYAVNTRSSQTLRCSAIKLICSCDCVDLLLCTYSCWG